MTPRRWSRVAEVFDAVSTVPPDERASYLDRVCTDDAVRREVESLLRHDAADDPLEASPLAGVWGDEQAWSPPDLAGRRLGRYRLVRRIATGGMGEVYLGVRADQEFEQEVAVKLVRSGLDSDRVLRRFRRERQTLASLTHPMIARVFDGGVTDEGRPYLVMEHIDGVPIDEYCDEHRLTLRERIGLFRQVCAAVQHAHERLVVHLDLKPGNILVAADGTPRLLDFGIARLLSPGETASEATGPMARVLTPDYASPEQMRGEPISTASDVYSLGVVLFELLAGRRPYTTGGRTSAEVERIVCERPPPRPSAGGRRELRGDLDRIVLKTLRKEPERRYGGVDRLSDDLDRYLRGLPVSARRGTAGYRLARFAGRNRVPLAAAFVVVLAVIAAMAGIAWQARQAAAAAKLAGEEARTATRVAQLLISLFEQSDPTISPREPTLRELLDRSAERITGELDDEPAVQAELLCVIGGVNQHLGRFDEAHEQFARSMAIRERAFGPESVEVALSLNNLGVLAIDRSDYDAAITMLERSVRIYADALERGGRPLRLHREGRVDVTGKGLATALANLGLARVSSGDLDAARPVLVRALERLETLEIDDPRLHTAAIDALATVHLRAGELADAERLFRDSLERRRAIHAGDHPLVAASMNNLATVLLERGNAGDAATLFESSLAMRRRVYGAEHPAVVIGLANLGKVHRRRGDHAAARRYLAEALEMARRVLPEGHASTEKIARMLEEEEEGS